MRDLSRPAVLAVLGALLAASLPAAAPAAPPSTLCGFDVAWIQGKFGRSLTTGFDANDWQRVLGRARAAQAKAVRVWVLNGRPSGGVLWSSSDPHVPTGIDPALVKNVETVANLAKANGARIYWTLMDGFVPQSGQTWPQLDVDRFWNVYNGDWGIGALWQTNVLGPVLDAIAKHPDALYAVDLLNEVEGPVNRSFFRGSWLGARRFVADTARFVHARAPGVRVTASAGWDDAPWDILLGRFDGLGLDFLDVHAYDDSGSIFLGDLLASHARSLGVPIVLGEFGQKSLTKDPALQQRVLAGFLDDARRLGFESAFAWRLEDEMPCYSFYDGNVARPGVGTFTWYATH